MNKKKLILWIILAAVLLVAGRYGLQLFISSDDQIAQQDTTKEDLIEYEPVSPKSPRTVLNDGTRPDTDSVGEAGRTILTNNDPDGKPRCQYRVKNIQTIDPGTCALQHPSMWRVYPDGKRLYLRAASAIVKMEKKGDGFQLYAGHFRGRVELIFDRSGGKAPGALWHTDPKKSSRDIVKITADSVEYDQAMHVLKIEGEFALKSRKTDITGTGLTITIGRPPGGSEKEVDLNSIAILAGVELTNQAGGMLVHPMQLKAETLNMSLYQRSGSTDPSWLVAASGRPAQVVESATVITGNSIVLDAGNEAVKVTGAGSMRYSRGKSSTPQTGTFTWSGGLVLHGRSGFGEIAGNVQLRDLACTVDCHRLRIFFVKDRNKEGTSGKVFNTGFRDYAISRVECTAVEATKEQVVITNLWQSPRHKNRALMRLTLKGRKILYDKVAGELAVTGNGLLFLEDYRQHPTGSKDNKDHLISGHFPSPRQWACTWQGAMYFSEQKRCMKLQDEAVITFRGGRDAVLPDGFYLPWTSGTTEKRSISLKANVMDMWFALSVEPQAPTSSAEDSLLLGRMLGLKTWFMPMRGFRANTDVTFFDSVGEVETVLVAERMLLDTTKHTMHCYGDRKVTITNRKATVTMTDLLLGRTRTISGTELIYDFVSGVFKQPQ